MRVPTERSMGTVKKTLLQQGMRLMTDPRVMTLMQNERVMKAVMVAMSMPGKAQSFAQEQVAHLAKAMALATEREVRDLQRTVRKLEEEIERMRADQTASDGGKKRKSAAERDRT